MQKDEFTPPPQSAWMLKTLNRLYRRGQLHIYAGTVPEHVKAKRRAKNKVARKQRRINRQRAK